MPGTRDAIFFVMILHRCLQATFVLALSLFVACGKKSESVVRPDVDVAPEEAELSIVPGTIAEIPADAPAESGWQTEEWSGEIQIQLDYLTRAIIGKDTPPDTAAEFIGHDLHPENLEQVGSSEVRRLPAGSKLESQSSLKKLVTQLQAQGEPHHATAKIISITEVDGGEVETAIIFHADGIDRDAGKRFQLNARWSCRWQNTDGGWELSRLKVLEFEEVRAPVRAFEDATEAAIGGDENCVAQFYRGQDHWMARIEMRLGIDISAWQGLALADVDGDGLEDIYVSQSGGLPNRLLRHRPDGTLEDISAAAGVDWLEVAHGSLFADLDNDGDPDLIVGSGSGILVMENDGAGKFRIAASKLLTDGLPYSIAAADIDQDGDLDLYLCGYTRRAGVRSHHVFVHPVPYHDANNGGRNALFRNDGDWRFTDVTKITGMGDHNTRFSYAATWEDFDLDGDLDLYVANDFGRNSLYRNELAQTGRVRFKDVAEEAGVVDVAPGMSACWGDYDNDGRADLYVGNMFSAAGNRIATQPHFQAGADHETRSQFLHHAGGNSLFRNTGGGSFEEVSEPMGVNLGRWAWSSKFADLDNDGWQDIVVANGFITQQDSGDL
ncbi:MAG: hypothetical protein ACI8XO_001689 [Verrucomicrobiales bacterium]